MTIIRRIIGLSIVVLLGLTSLHATIWAVGLGRAVFGDKFLADIPKEVISQVPALSDELYTAAIKPGALENPNAAAWAAAAGKTGILPSELLGKIGVFSWLENELVAAIDNIGKVLKGELDPKTVELDFRPLKAAISSPEIRDYIQAVLSNLPPCEPAEQALWMGMKPPLDGKQMLPACNPDISVTPMAIDMVMGQVVNIPDTRPLLAEGVQVPWGMNVSRIINYVMWAMFLLPLAFIFMGASIATLTRRGFFQVSGLSLVLGGLGPLAMTSLVGGSLLEMIHADPSQWTNFSGSTFWNTETNKILSARIGDMIGMIFERLFAPVEFVGLVVCAAGLVLLTFSLFASSEPRD